MRQVRVSLPAAPPRGYDILIEEGLLARAPGMIAALPGPASGEPCVLVCDKTVEGLYGGAFHEGLTRAGVRADIAVIPPGEKAKTLAFAERLLEAFAGAGLTRKGLVIALGGGVTGDLAGFAAGVYMRGTAFVQVPTTLLAQVDSSVGGKTGVNLGPRKNYCGVFVQPLAVYADPRTLSSLPEDEYRSGLAEAAKYGIMADAVLFDFLDENAAAVLGRDMGALTHIVERCLSIKARIVAADERESGPRMLLNYGHTFGHAFESLSGYALSHGEAVALGMRAAARLAASMGMCPKGEAARQEALLDRLGLGLSRPRLSAAQAHAAMARDKKATARGLPFILPRSTGRAEIVRDVSPKLAMAALEGLLS